MSDDRIESRAFRIRAGESFSMPSVEFIAEDGSGDPIDLSAYIIEQESIIGEDISAAPIGVASIVGDSLRYSLTAAETLANAGAKIETRLYLRDEPETFRKCVLAISVQIDAVENWNIPVDKGAVLSLLCLSPADVNADVLSRAIAQARTEGRAALPASVAKSGAEIGWNLTIVHLIEELASALLACIIYGWRKQDLDWRDRTLEKLKMLALTADGNVVDVAGNVEVVAISNLGFRA
jgi:hypothetical protein